MPTARKRRKRTESETAPSSTEGETREHDQDSDPPRTAVSPETTDEERDWGRQDGC